MGFCVQAILNISKQNTGDSVFNIVLLIEIRLDSRFIDKIAKNLVNLPCKESNKV